mgnify:CR=1 FL=1
MSVDILPCTPCQGNGLCVYYLCFYLLFMGIFGFFSSLCDRYSQHEHALTELEIRRLVSEVRVETLKDKEEYAVEEAILARRHGDGKISLRQICEVLRSLQNKRVISIYDRKKLMKVFEEHFRKFKN